jgi:acetyl-CoA C-acetyltransferase
MSLSTLPSSPPPFCCEEALASPGILTLCAARTGHAIKHAVQKAGVDPAMVEDVFMGCGMPEGETGMNVARNATLWAGLPVTSSGTTINRFCSSGLQAVASAAHSILVDKVPCAIGGGVDSITLVQPKAFNPKAGVVEKTLFQHPVYKALWMPMIDTADLVATRYKISRERQDEYALLSQQRTAAAQQAGKYADEIVPLDTDMAMTDKETKEVSYKRYTVSKDECNRADTTLESLQKLKPVNAAKNPDASITAGPVIRLPHRTAYLSRCPPRPTYRTR